MANQASEVQGYWLRNEPPNPRGRADGTANNAVPPYLDSSSQAAKLWVGGGSWLIDRWPF